MMHSANNVPSAWRERALFALILLGLSCGALSHIAQAAPARHTAVTIVGDEFHINGRPTYAGRSWNGRKIEGLLINARLRMKGEAFDDGY